MNETKIAVAVLLTLIVAAPTAAGVRRPVDRDTDGGRDRHETQHEQEWERHEENHHAERDAHGHEHARERDAHVGEHEREQDVFVSRRDDRGNGHRGRHGRKWAEVVGVRPIYDRVRVQAPRQECHTETVTRHRGRPRLGGTVIGATVGGAVGHGMGHDRRSRRRGTIFGAILGGVLGHEIGDRHARRRGRGDTREVERCRTVDTVSWEKRVVGYDVDYKYRGRIYHTQMDEHPGRRIRVKVDVQPRGHRF